MATTEICKEQQVLSGGFENLGSQNSRKSSHEENMITEEYNVNGEWQTTCYFIRRNVLASCATKLCF